jgi:flagellar protein FliO/FliZ
MSTVLPSLLWFALVIALIPIALAIVKRAQGIAPTRGTVVRLVGGLSLGARERIAVVEAGGKWLVIGITAQSVTLLTELDGPPADIDAGTPATSPTSGAFGRILSTLRHDATPRA